MKRGGRTLRWYLLAVCLVAGSLAHGGVIGITTANVSVRNSPNGQQVDSLGKDTAVAILDVSNAWAKVLYVSPPGSANTKTGWIELSYIQVTSGAGGDDCETEYKTNAEVCVEVTDASLDCRKDYTGEFYRGCQVTLEYEVSTNYRGGAYLDADIECQVEIKYTGRNLYSWRTASDYQDDSHSLYANESSSESLTFQFSFNSMNEVTQAKIESATCEVDSVDLW